MDTDDAARILAELGNATRLTIYRLLVRAGPAGMAVGEIQNRIGIPASTLSHHIQRLVWVGLVEQERDGRTLICRPRPGMLQSIVEYLMAECCQGFQDEPRGDAAECDEGACG